MFTPPPHFINDVVCTKDRQSKYLDESLALNLGKGDGEEDCGLQQVKLEGLYQYKSYK